MKKFFSGLALLTAVVALASCEDDLFGDRGNKYTYGKNEVVVKVGGNTMATRAEGARTVVAPSNVYDLPAQEGEMQVSLVETVINLDDATCYDAVMGTRGTPVYTENFGTVYGSFYGTPYAVEDLVEPSSKSALTGDAWGGGQVSFNKLENTTIYTHDYANAYEWPSGKQLLYFFEAIGDGQGVGDRTYYDDGSISFHYTSPIVGNKSGEAQKDILFTSRLIDEEDQNSEGNKILFYHALTGVKFKLNSDVTYGDASNPVKLAIKSVTINDLYNAGTCTVDPYYTTGSWDTPSNPIKGDKSNNETKSAICSTWTYDGTTANFTQEFSSELKSESYDKDKSQFPESFYEGYNGCEPANNNLNDANYSQTFWFIPQDVEGKTITVTYTTTYGEGENAITHEFTKTIAFPTGDNGYNGAGNSYTDWRAGELRTFALNVSQVVVDIDDVVVRSTNADQYFKNEETVWDEDGKPAGTETRGDVKKNLTTYNTGTAPEYQRIIVTANWVYPNDEYGQGDVIVGQHDLSTDNNWKAAIDTENWILGNDGYYYYKYPINPGCTPEHPLIKKDSGYQSPTVAPFANTHLEMTLCVQAIQFDGKAPTVDGTPFQSGWGNPLVGSTTESVASQLSTNIEGTTK